MLDNKKSTKSIKCKAQFARTVARTGKWRGKKASEYIKYKKIKKEPKKTSRLNRYSGFVSLDENGNPKYVRIGKKGRPKLVLARIYNKMNKSKKE